MAESLPGTKTLKSSGITAEEILKRRVEQHGRARYSETRMMVRESVPVCR